MFSVHGCTQSNEAVRGVWLTNVDSEVLNSHENIIEAVDLIKECGFNTIFVVTWNKAMTQYPSKIMKAFTGVEIDTTFTGRDPLKELIDEAHKRDLKVIAWFEFGFSSSFEENGGTLLELKPEWAALNSDGELVQKNGFEWMNSFRPDVQDFVLSIVMEVVENYDIDGIQGDDRLPAAPSEGGYDEYTVSLYKEQHNGNEPPEDCKDPEWLQWRADILNDFMGRIYNSVKGFDSTLIVSMAPSIFPWSLEEYLQDWPTWVNNGYVDLLCPQLYRYDYDEYKAALAEVLNGQVAQNQSNVFYPGILLKVGDYQPSLEFLRQMISENRKHNVNGEVFFFYEGVKKYKDYFINSYAEKIAFPKLVKH